ncbi:hypothetical protein SWPG_00146 [Synechococcus phage S-CBM2]|nr:hypothetical protein SWPG_00146 [Synechococcus phage S-CBM2]
MSLNRKVSDAGINSIKITTLTGQVLPSIEPLIQEITILQSIDCPSVRIILSIQDNVGLYDRLVGQEILYLDMAANNDRLIWQSNLNEIRDVTDSEKIKFYNLVFVSRESYLNDNQRLLFAYKNKKISGIVRDILKTRFGTEKKVEIESTEYTGSFICPNYRPYDFIEQLAAKAIRAGKPDQAGFLFYEATDGFHFVSMDSLCEKKPVAKYIYQPKNVAGGNIDEDQYSLQSFVLDSNLNLVENLAKGAYGGIFYGVDFVNLKPENNIAKRWSIESNYSRMSHLGTTNPFEQLKKVDKQIGGVARVFYNPVAPHLFGDTITRTATNQSGPIGGPTGDKIRKAMNIGGGNYETSADARPYTISRFLALDHISGRCTLPGNLSIKAGDVIEIVVPRWEGDKTVPDKKHSGNYLVTGVTHVFKHPQTLKTILNIARDSYQ